MSIQSDPIKRKQLAPDDLTIMISDISTGIQYKFILFMFIFFMILSSDVFINRVLVNFEGAVDYKNPTSWGVTLQGLFLVIMMVCLDVLIKQKIV